MTSAEPDLRVRAARILTRAPVVRSARVRSWYLRGARAARRARRHRLEARGDDRFSRPALGPLHEALVERFGAIREGVFVEAGANDGFEQSNTYWLERFRGWTGVLVEPVPSLAAEARRARPGARVVEAALVPFGQDGGTVTVRYGGTMSVVAGARGSEEADREHVAHAFALGLEDPYDVEVRARTLSAVLDEAGVGEVDLLSLDVEGFEPQVLRGLDLERHAPRWLLVEIDDPHAGRGAVEEALGDRYAVEAILSPRDVLYARRSRAGASAHSSPGTARSTSTSAT